MIIFKTDMEVLHAYLISTFSKVVGLTVQAQVI
jgi:hypothetical protein